MVSLMDSMINTTLEEDQTEFIFHALEILVAETDRKDFLRGYGYQGGGSRGSWTENVKEMAYGPEFKEAIMNPGGWNMGLNGFRGGIALP
jgi:hypothetical protein